LGGTPQELSPLLLALNQVGPAVKQDILEVHYGVTEADRVNTIKRCVELGFTQALAHVVSANGMYASTCLTPDVLLRTTDEHRVLEGGTLNGPELFKIRLLEQEGFCSYNQICEWRSLEESQKLGIM
jgi:hypothetical protein